jgi:hypothetical protein
MVKGHMFVIGVAALGLSVAATSATHPKKGSPADAGKGRAQQLLQNCDAHKFETVVQEMVDGQPHQSKVKLCGKEGQSEKQWIGTLKDAVAKLETNSQMPAAVKNQIITALNREILRLAGGGSSQAAGADNPVGGSQFAGLEKLRSAKSGSSSIAQPMSEYPALPPIPETSSSALPPPRLINRAPVNEYAALPPLPTAPPPPTRVLGGAGTSSFPLLPAPKMSFSCHIQGEVIEGPCTGFTRDTLLTVHADEDLPSGTSLRFVRDGDPKADVALAALKRGRSVELAFPADVCRHVVGGKLELRVVRSGQEVNSDGPYNLSC